MESSFKKQVNKFLREKKNHTRYIVVLACLAVVVAAATFASLHFSGQAKTHKQKVLVCQIKAHAHEKDCYDKDGKVVCGQADYIIHQHNDDCYDQEGVLVCQLPQIEKHEHNNECYEKERVLSCGQEESEEHQHTDACYTEEEVLSCGKLELHTHDEKDCYTTDEAGNKVLTCQEIVLEEHIHGESCFKIVELTDAELNGVEDPDEYVDEESSTAPEEEGKTVVFPTQSCYDEQGEIVCGLEEHTHSDECLNEEGEAVCGILEHTHVAPAEELQKVYQDESVIITATYDASANIPEEAELRAYAVTEETDPDRYEQRVEEALAAIDAESSSQEDADSKASDQVAEPQVRVYNIGFFIGDEEIEPAAPVTITIQFLDAEGLAFGDPITVIHFGEQGTQVFDGTLEEGATTTFETDAFSDFVIVFPSFAAKTNSNGTVNYISGSEEAGTKYEATIVKYEDLKAGEDYVIFYKTGYENQILFLGADSAQPVAINKSVDLGVEKTLKWDSSEMTNPAASLVWQIYGIQGGISGSNAYSYCYLQSQATGKYLRLNNNGADRAGTGGYTDGDAAANSYIQLHLIGASSYTERTWWGTQTLHAQVQIQTANGNNKLFYAKDGKASENNGFGGYDWTAGDKDSTAQAVYFAKVKVTYQKTGYEKNYPLAADTRKPGLNRNSFYNVEVTENGMVAVPGCTFELTPVNAQTHEPIGKSFSVKSPEAWEENPMKVKLAEALRANNITSGTHTFKMVQTGVPDGFVINPEIWWITISIGEETIDGVKVPNITTMTMTENSTRNEIGIVFNYREGVVEAKKTAEVVTYEDRAYRVDLTAESEALTYTSSPINVSLVVDQSNSMLFPADLGQAYDKNGNAISKITIGAPGTNGGNLSNLNKNKVYYIIVKPESHATMYAIWWGKTGEGENDGSWLFQDAAYYAKAYYEQTEGGNLVVFPRVGAENVKADLGTIDGKKAIAYNGADLDKCPSGSSRGTNFIDGEYDIYEALPEVKGTTAYYNRLTYLEESMADLIMELATLNPKSHVSLTQFNKEVCVDRCIEADLNKEGVLRLVNAVGLIDTEGGTRQDLALKHVVDGSTCREVKGTIEYESCKVGSHLSTTYRNYVVLITDGAPINSGNSIYTSSEALFGEVKNAATSLKGYGVTLATIGLSVDKVEGGSQLLSDIATADSNGHWFWSTQDSSQLSSILLGKFFNQLAAKIKISPIAGGDVRDVISDSFYLYDAANPYEILEEGAWIDAEGRKLDAKPTSTVDQYGNPIIYGQVHYKEDGQCYVEWLNQSFVASLNEGDYVDNTSNQFASAADIMSGKIQPSGRVFRKSNGDLMIGWYNSDKSPASDWATKEENIAKTSGGWTEQVKRGMWTIWGWIEWTEDVYHQGTGIDNAAATYYAKITPVPEIWHATLALKAKEDFIGGNAIDTNDEAFLAINRGTLLDNLNTKEKITFPVPNVNVRLLPMSHNNSEVTVFLGDMINGPAENNDVFQHTPLESLQYLYKLIGFEKLTKGQGIGNVRNYKGWTDVYDTAEGDKNVDKSICNIKTFNLQYAIERTLTESNSIYKTHEEWWTYLWGQLEKDNSVELNYTYDDASSHGPVGKFIFEIKKEDTAKPENNPEHSGDHTEWEMHVAKDVGDHVETYTLTVTYEAYSLAQRGRQNEHNNTDGKITGNTTWSSHSKKPGVEVGTGAELKSGYGEVTSTNIHWVNVVAGQLQGVKKIADSMVLPDEEQTFIICLQRVGAEPITGDNITENKNCELKVPVTINRKTKEASFTFTNIPRGEYIIHEHIEPNAEYQMNGYTVEEGNGIHYYVDSDKHIHVGYYKDPDSDDTDEIVDVIHYHPEKPPAAEECYYDINPEHDPLAIQYSCWREMEAFVKVIVENIKKGFPIQLLKVSKQNNNELLEGAEFKLYAKDDFNTSTGKPNMNAEPVWEGISTGNGGWTRPMDPLPVGIYYLVETKAPDGYYGLTDFVEIEIMSNGDVHIDGPDGLKGTIHQGDDGTILIKVPNSTGYELPKSGGHGTTPYTTSALILIVTALAALMYKTLRSRRRDKRA